MFQTDEQFESFLGSWLAGNSDTSYVLQASNVPSSHAASRQEGVASTSPGNGRQGPKPGLAPQVLRQVDDFDVRRTDSAANFATSSGSLDPLFSTPHPSVSASAAAYHPAHASLPDTADARQQNVQSGRNAKLMEKNRLAQARFREKQKEKERDLERQIQALQQQLQDAHLEATGVRRQNEVLTKLMELRQSQVEVLTETASAQSAAAAGSQPKPGASSAITLEPGSQSALTPLQIKSLTSLQAAVHWREYVQRVATLLVDVETPKPPAQAVRELEALALEGAKFLETLSIVNPVVSRMMRRLNFDTMKPSAFNFFSIEVFRQPFWMSKVDALNLTEDQKEQVLFVERRLHETLERIDRDTAPLHREFRSLVPDTVGIERSVRSSVRTQELVNQLRQSLHMKDEAWFHFSSTILGKVLTGVQFARYCVTAYPHLPLAKAIACYVMTPAGVDPIASCQTAGNAIPPS